jgi:hypothetical protein
MPYEHATARRTVQPQSEGLVSAPTSSAPTTVPTTATVPVPGLARGTGTKSAPVRRLWNPFKKSDEQKAKDLEKSKRKEDILKARAEMKAKDKKVRLEAKAANKTHKSVSKNVKAGYAQAGESAKFEKTEDHANLEKEFQVYLAKERQAREEARQTFTDGVGTPEQQELSEVAEENAADAVWKSAPPHIRAFRPLRFDEFDKALREVEELRSQHAAEEQSDVAQALEANEKSFGAPMDPEKALKKVREKRDLDRMQVRSAQSKGEDPTVAKEMDKAKANSKASDKLSESSAKRDVGKGEQARVKADTERKQAEEKYLPDSDLEDAKDGTKTGASVVKYAGKGDKYGTKGVVKKGIGGATEGQGSEISDLVGTSTTGLGQIIDFVSELLNFASIIADIKRGTADKGAKLKATQSAVSATNKAAGVTKTTLTAARDGVQHFGGMGTVITEAGSALPIVGLVTSVLSVIDAALDLYPIADRLITGLQSVDEAVLGGKAPLAASMDRVNSRNAQLVEKSTFDIAKNSTMVGLHIAEIASAGGFGIPMAAKATVTLTGLAHSLGHKIYDTVSESRAATAKKDFGVKHKEGASRDLVKHDIGTSVDILIVAAQKHNLEYAKKILMDYGVTASEITSMRMGELREKVLDGLDATGDPKTVSEKIDDAKEKVSSALGKEKKPNGPKDDTSTLDKIKAVPGDIGKALAGLPGKISKQIDAMKAKHADAKELISSKNALNYGGKNDRGKGAVLQHMFRGQDKIEKSFAKVRNDLAAEGMPGKMLPRTSEDRQRRSELAEQKKASQSGASGGAQQIDKAFMAKVQKASVPELYDILGQINQADPAQIGNLKFLEWEVARRLSESGAKA